jgi:NitT/TauT family transport system substrate-binding protein
MNGSKENASTGRGTDRCGLTRREFLGLAAASAGVAFLGGCRGSSGGGSSGVLEIVVFDQPSLGAFLPTVIEAKSFDAENGVDIRFIYRPPDAYNVEFPSGQYQLGGSAALLSEANRVSRGVEVTYLFNLFDYFGAVVAISPDVEALEDLPGHTLAAAASTTNYAMFQWFAQRQGVDLSEVDVQNNTPSGLVTQALVGRSDAVQLWEPAYSTLLAREPSTRVLDMKVENWREAFGFSDIPYLGVAAHRSWVEDNEESLQPLFDTYKQAADWTLQNPAEAGEIIAETMPQGNASVIQDLIERNERLQLRVAPAADISDPIRSVFEAGVETHYLEDTPGDTIIYEGLEASS